MFSRTFVATVTIIAALTTSVMSVPTTAGGQCNSGSLKCCNSESTGLFSLVGTCSPLSVLGLLQNGGQCTQQTVCCNDNSVNALVAISCSPINLNL
ncbi:hydrophobin-251 [Armillaria luteobubalina]|uniref:Hydrophobin n=1 Tax=Armillaria luteobubalina TaxID=153913 RepID=A0AA39V1Z9_9AGAR|nr:hydrophobin-251 [Armillaria luteobubalina]